MTFLDVGAFAFGLVIGWFTYFVNRYREKVALADVATIIGALGGAAVLSLFPQGTAMFAAYGIGLAVGFFAYFVVLLLIVRAQGWSMAWFLDGRRPELGEGEQVGDGSHAMRSPDRPGRDGSGLGGG